MRIISNNIISSYTITMLDCINKKRKRKCLPLRHKKTRKKKATKKRKK